MPVPPPLPDPQHLEQRLIVLAEMLDHAVDEVRQVVAAIRSATPTPTGGDDARPTD